MTLMMKEDIGLAGHYRLQVMREGLVHKDTGWFKNLITDQGLDFIGGHNPPFTLPDPTQGGHFLNSHCGVGTGTTAPAFTDTRLASPLAMFPPGPGTGGVAGGVLSYVAGVTPYWSCVWTYQFALGAVVGNIAEVGVGNCTFTDTDVQVFSRCLILDGLGNPTIISVTALDALVVTYELRYYIATGDNTYSMVIDGTFGPVTYTGTYRRMLIGTVPQIFYPVFGGSNATPNVNAFMSAYGGFALGPITGQPIFSQKDAGGTFIRNNTPYINGTYFCEFNATMPLGASNFPGGISGISTTCNHGMYQFSVTPSIPKTIAYVLNIVWRVYWSRYP